MLTWPKPFPKPVRRRDDEPFWDSIARRRLELQRCGACGRFRYPAAPVCPECLLEAVEWVPANGNGEVLRSEEHTSELQSLMRSSYAVFCLKKKKQTINRT